MYTRIYLSKQTSSGFVAAGIDMETDVNIGIAICRGIDIGIGIGIGIECYVLLTIEPLCCPPFA